MPLNRNKLKSRRLSLGLTLEEVASELNVSKQTVQRYESGQIARIYTDTVEMLSSALKCPPAYLMDWADDTILLSDEEKNLVSSFRTLPSSDQDDVIDYVDYRASKVSAPKTVVMDILPDEDDDGDYQVIAAHADPDITPEEMQENIRRLKEEIKKKDK